jgi:hypothetical protein
MKYLKRFNESNDEGDNEEDEILMDIILDYETNNNIIVNDKTDMINYLNDFMDDINYDWDRLFELYDEYGVDSWEDLMIKLIDKKIKNLVD